MLAATLALMAFAAQAEVCQLYPIALSASVVSRATPGAVLPDIYQGVQSGNFGWLTWAGSPAEPALVASLAPPGNADAYVNPDNAADHQLSVGDWDQLVAASTVEEPYQPRGASKGGLGVFRWYASEQRSGSWQ